MADELPLPPPLPASTNYLKKQYIDAKDLTMDINLHQASIGKTVIHFFNFGYQKKKKKNSSTHVLLFVLFVWVVVVHQVNVDSKAGGGKTKVYRCADFLRKRNLWLREDKKRKWTQFPCLNECPLKITANKVHSKTDPKFRVSEHSGFEHSHTCEGIFKAKAKVIVHLNEFQKLSEGELYFYLYFFVLQF